MPASQAPDASATNSHNIAVAGDLPLADFKVVRPGSTLPYAAPYEAAHLKKSVYQVGTAAMSPNTARDVLTSCGAPCCGLDLDNSMLRIGGSCAVSAQPSFGIMDVDWDAREARIQIVRTDGGGTVRVVDPATPVALDFAIDLQLCLDGA